MSQMLNVEGFSMPIEIESYSRSKSLKVYIKDGYIKVTKPTWCPKKDAINYLVKNTEHILKLYENNEINKREKVDILHSPYLLYKGQKLNLNIKENDNKKVIVKIDENGLAVYIPDNCKNAKEVVIKSIKTIFIRNVRTIIQELLQEYCEIMKIKAPNFRIKDCKTMWGSCSAKSNLNFNFRLIMMPEEVIKSIIVHELCHLKYMNHSDKFWNLVYTYYDKEKYARANRWIKDNMNILNII